MEASYTVSGGLRHKLNGALIGNTCGMTYRRLRLDIRPDIFPGIRDLFSTVQSWSAAFANLVETAPA